MNKKLIYLFFNQSIKEMLEYKTTSILSVVFGMIFFLIEILSGLIYFKYTNNLLGYTKYDYFYLINASYLIQNTYNFCFVKSHEELSDLIIYGELDYIFVRPLNSYWYFSFKSFDIPSLINIFGSIIFQIYLFSFYSISIKKIIYYILLILLGVLFLFCINRLFVCIFFWKEKATFLLGISEYLMDFSSRPRKIYPNYISFILVYIMPLILVINLPLDIQKNVNYIHLLYYNIYIIILFLMTYIVWFLGIKKYQSSN